MKQSKADKEKKKAAEYDPSDGGDELISEKEFTKTFSKAMKIPVGDTKRLFKAADTSRDGFVDVRVAGLEHSSCPDAQRGRSLVATCHQSPRYAHHLLEYLAPLVRSFACHLRRSLPVSLPATVQ